MQLANQPVRPTAGISPPLYSPMAVQIFAFIIGPLFGGVLAYHNLKDLGRPVPARRLLWNCLFFTAILLLVVTVVQNNVVATGLNIAGGLWVSRQYQQLVPEANQYQRKPILKPLIFAVLISAVFMAPMVARLLL